MFSRQTSLEDAKVFIGEALRTAKGYETIYSSKKLERMDTLELSQEMGEIENLAAQTNNKAQIILLEDEELPQAYTTYNEIADRTSDKINTELLTR